ncbi:hypothetical protein NA57DRAFT_57377 [Rhizodiscina lignyota]|uniref:Secreted protein n=1 Tax=Rhizodiscina lignyota TaxID=1504668 RepID=A0A9P4IEJ9_9PEZI|nr:hypothetical protein NA57DRAFT_57377 [Rhizodiscina lignyota]
MQSRIGVMSTGLIVVSALVLPFAGVSAVHGPQSGLIAHIDEAWSSNTGSDWNLCGPWGNCAPVSHLCGTFGCAPAESVCPPWGCDQPDSAPSGSDNPSKPEFAEAKSDQRPLTNQDQFAQSGNAARCPYPWGCGNTYDAFSNVLIIFQLTFNRAGLAGPQIINGPQPDACPYPWGCGSTQQIMNEPQDSGCPYPWGCGSGSRARANPEAQPSSAQSGSSDGSQPAPAQNQSGISNQLSICGPWGCMPLAGLLEQRDGAHKVL